MELTSKKQAEQLDFLLTSMLENKTSYDVKVANSLFFPEENFDYCYALFKILIEYDPKLVIYKELLDVGYQAFPLKIVPFFLKEGGFTSIFLAKEKELNAKEEKERITMEKLKYETKIAKWKYKTYWIVAIAGIIGFLLSIYNTFFKK